MQWKRAKILLRESSDEGESPTGRGWGRPGFAGRGCTPHSFSSCRKRMRRARWKKKTLGRKTAPLAPFLLKYGGRANQDSGNLTGSRRVRRTPPEQRAYSPAFGTAQHLSGVVIARALPLAPRVPLRYALPRLSPEGKSKGEGPQPLPFASLGGVGETGEAPPAADEASLFRGSGAIGGPEKGPGIAMPQRC